MALGTNEVDASLALLELAKRFLVFESRRKCQGAIEVHARLAQIGHLFPVAPVRARSAVASRITTRRVRRQWARVDVTLGTDLRAPVAYRHSPSTTDMIAMDAIW